MALSCVRIELTTLALSAPRSTDWANGPYTREISKWQTIHNLGINSGTFPSVHRPRAKADVKNRDWKNSIRIITISISFEMLEKKLSVIKICQSVNYMSLVLQVAEKIMTWFEMLLPYICWKSHRMYLINNTQLPKFSLFLARNFFVNISLVQNLL